MRFLFTTKLIIPKLAQQSTHFYNVFHTTSKLSALCDCCLSPPSSSPSTESVPNFNRIPLQSRRGLRKPSLLQLITYKHWTKPSLGRISSSWSSSRASAVAVVLLSTTPGLWPGLHRNYRRRLLAIVTLKTSSTPAHRPNSSLDLGNGSF